MPAKFIYMATHKSDGYYWADNTIDKNHRWLLGWEPYFEKWVWIASIDTKSKHISFCHGYYPPHQHGYRTMRLAKKLGYTFSNYKTK